MAEVDRLEVAVEAQATKASQQLDKLISKLNSVSGALSGINASGLTGLANGVQRLSTSMQSMNNVKTSDFTRLASNITKLGNINTANLNNAASAMSQISRAFNNVGDVSSNAVKIGELSKNISKLGNKSVTNAIANIPRLSTALNDMMTQLSRTPRVSNNLIRLTEALSRLTNQGSRVDSATNSIRSSLNGYVNYSNRATKSTLSLAAAVGTLYAKYWLLVRAVRAFMKIVESSMDYIETLNYFDVTVDKIGNDAISSWKQSGYDSAQAYYESFRNRMTDLTSKMTGFQVSKDGTTTELDIKNLSLDVNEILNYQATFAQMTDSMGLLEDTTINVSNALTMLGADWSSLKNIDMDTAMNKFASALTGQIRPVRELGIDISQTTLETYALKYGISDAVSEMSQAAKVQLRLLAILDQSKVAMGDIANTINQPANQLRVLKQNFSNLARIIGNMFLPIVAKILPYINGLVIALRRLFTWISGLMGIDITGLSSSIGDSALDIEDASDSTDDLTDGLTDATKQAEKLKNITTGIDELNIATQDTTSDSGSNSGTTGTSSGYGVLDDAITAALAEYQAIWDEAFANMESKAENIADKIQAAFKKIYDIAEPTRLAVKKLWDEGLSLLANFTWKALEDFWNEFLVPIGKWTLGVGLPMFIDAINNFLLKINWSAINSALKNFWQALEPFAEKVGEGLIRFFSALLAVGADFINAVVPSGLNGIAGALKKISPEQAEKIGYALGIIATALIGFKTIGTIAIGIESLAKVVAGSKIATGFLIFKDALLAVGGAIGGFLINIAKMLGVGKLLSGFTPFATLQTDMALSGASLPALLKTLILTPITTFFTVTLPTAFTSLAASLGSAFGLAGSAAIVAGGAAIAAAVVATVAAIVYTATHWNEIKEFWTKKVPNWWNNSVIPFFQKLPGQIADFFTSLPSKLGYALGFATGTVVKWVAELIKTVATKVPQVIDNVVSFFAEMPARIGKWFTSTITSFVAFASSLVETVKTNFPVVVDSILSFFINLPENFLEFGKNIIQGLWSGIKGAIDSFMSSISDFIDGFVQGFKDALGIHSPSTAFAEIGGYIIAGLLLGIENAWTGFITFISGLPQKIITEFGDIKSKFVTKGNDIINGIKEGWGNLASNFATWLGQKRESVVTNFGSYWNSFVTKGNDIINGIKKGWNDLSSGFATWLSQMREKVVSWFGSFYNSFISKGNDIINGIKKGWDNLSSSFSGWLSDRNENVVSWFGDLKSKFVNKGTDIVSGIKKGWNDNWSNFKEWLNGLPSKIISPFSNMYNEGKKIVTNFINGLKSAKLPTFHINWSTSTKSFFGLDIDIPIPNISFYKDGGFPNMGEAFIARENGPEMVGRIGNKSAVANNDQITTAITNAVVQGMQNASSSGASDALLREQNELLRRILAKDTSVSLNGRKVNEELENVKKSNGFSFAT